MNRRPAHLLSILFCAALCSCDDRQGTGIMHQITGKLADSSGKPLSNVKVSVFGYPHKSNESFSKVLDLPGPADKYTIDVPEGIYDAPRASITTTYNGRSYMLPLAAADNTRDWGGQKESRDSLVRDFIWRVSGPRPTVLGENADTAGFWGAAISIDKGADIGDFGVIEVTLTPEGPLIDGTPGKTLTFKRSIPWQKHGDHLLGDIPIGRYRATANITVSGSDKPRPLKLVLTSNNPASIDANSTQTTAASVTVEFEQATPRPNAEPGQEPKLFLPTLLMFPDKEKRGAFD